MRKGLKREDLLPLLPTAMAALIIIMWLGGFNEKMFTDPYSTILLSRDNILLGASISDDHQWRFPPIDTVPEKYEIAVIQFEDKRFNSHFGVDFIAMARSLYLNITHREILSGGSTLSMQTVRLARKGKPRTIREKVLESFQAIRIETSLSKDEILAVYASHAPFGGNVVGLEAAAWRYFGRSANNLSWGESALLAVLPNSPGLIHPGRNRQELKEKRDRLLEKLHTRDLINQDQMLLAQAEPLPSNPYPLPQLAPHVLEHSKRLNSEGPNITTIDWDLQWNLNYILDRHKPRLTNLGINNGAILVLRVSDGTVAGYMGNLPGEDVRNSYVDNVISLRSTGSLLKPFLYAAMVDTGELLPKQLVLDIPTRIGSYKPENHTGDFLGAVPADEAITHSLNVPTARMLRRFGLDRFYSILVDLGLTSLHRRPEEYGIPLILGGAEGSLWELVNIYGNIARDLTADAPYYLKTPLLYDGEEPGLLDNQNTYGGISTEAWWLATGALQNLKRPFMESNWEHFISSEKIAWKTGTSYGYRDAWAIGYNRDYVIGVWIGNSTGEGQPGIRGSIASGPILFEAFNILPEAEEIPVPENIVFAEICSQSGFLAGESCEETEMQYLPKTSHQGKVCPYHEIIHLDEDENYLVESSFYPVHKMVSRNWFVLPPLAAHYYQSFHGDYLPLPPKHPEAPLYSERSPAFSIIFPEEGTSIYIPRDYNSVSEKIVFEAASLDPEIILYWHIDDEFMAATKEIHQVEVYASAGPHTLTVVDSNGQRILRTFKFDEN